MASRVTIYNPRGVKISEVDADFYREWKISEFGEGSFKISINDPKFSEELVDFGNWVYVEHSKLPEWIGTIETPREWEGGVITVNCLSGEARLKRALTRSNVKLEGTTGDIFQQLIEEYGGNITGLVVGEVDNSGETSTFTEQYISLYEAANKLNDVNDDEWNVTPLVDSKGSVKFACNWKDKLGRRRKIKLFEDKVMKQGGRMVEQGEIYNSVFAHGTGSNYKPKLVGEYTDWDGVADYGLSEWLYSDASVNQFNNDKIAMKKTQEYKNPRRTFTLALADVSDLFQNIEIGDIFDMQLYSMGFTGKKVGLDTTVRILQMNYKDSENTVNIVADEVKNG